MSDNQQENLFAAPKTVVTVTPSKKPLPEGADFAFYFDSRLRFLAPGLLVLSLIYMQFIGIGLMPLFMFSMGLTGALRLRKPAITMNSDHITTWPLLGGRQSIFSWHSLLEVTSVNPQSLTILDVDKKYKHVDIRFMNLETRKQIIALTLDYYKKAKKSQESPA